MWNGLLSSSWTALAVVPTDGEVSADLVVDSMREAIAGAHAPVRCFDARGLDPAAAKTMAHEVASGRARGNRSVLVVDPLTKSLSGVHLVTEADAVLLVVRVGAMDLESLKSTVNIVGAERIIGSVAALVKA
jgi:hypothetical protein